MLLKTCVQACFFPRVHEQVSRHLHACCQTLDHSSKPMFSRYFKAVRTLRYFRPWTDGLFSNVWPVHTWKRYRIAPFKCMSFMLAEHKKDEKKNLFFCRVFVLVGPGRKQNARLFLSLKHQGILQGCRLQRKQTIPVALVKQEVRASGLMRAMFSSSQQAQWVLMMQSRGNV